MGHELGGKGLLPTADQDALNPVFAGNWTTPDSRWNQHPLVYEPAGDQLFREAWGVVLPYETFSSQSGGLHDASGHGRPVVVTDVGALGATVRHDGTGAVVTVDDAEALAAALVATAGPAGDAAAAAGRRATESSPRRCDAPCRLPAYSPDFAIC